MGNLLFDRYSYLHFAVGVVLYFWELSLTHLILLHILFEFGENTQLGMKLINRMSIWPGGKPTADSLLNSFGDILSSILGWLSVYYLDKLLLTHVIK